MMDEGKIPEREGTGEAKQTRRGLRPRLRRFFLRHLPLTLAGGVVFLALLAVGLYFAASSTAFENHVRKRLIAEIENATGGRAEIASFHWRLLDLDAEARGIVIHGLEDPGEAPYARIDALRARVSILGVLSPSVRLRDLEIIHPQLHLIVYADGSSNQPQPRRRGRPGKPVLQRLFNLEAGHVAVEDGAVDYDNRAAAFDFQNRYAPLNFEATGVSVAMQYVPASSDEAEHYHIAMGAGNVSLQRTVRRRGPAQVEGKMEASVDLEPARVMLRSLRITAHGEGEEERELEVSGALEDFNHPRWQAKADGDLDMRLLDAVTGYPDAPEGIAHLDLTAAGQGGGFHLDGAVHITGGAYIGTGVTAKGVTLEAKIHADEKRLQIEQIVARLRQGGEIAGAVDLQPWLPAVPAASFEPAGISAEERRATRNVLIEPVPISIPVNGKVTADFKDVAVDTILDMVASPPYQRLGIAAQISGPASATWAYGQASNVAVTTRFELTAPPQAMVGEVPASGAIDATYTQRNGGVELRKFELHLPSSDVEARGSLGAYPIDRASSMHVDLRTGNLSEFDAVLRSLGMKRDGRVGSAALPVALSGRAEFHGSWTGSLARPEIAGKLTASQLGLEMPTAQGGQNAPQFARLDSVEVEGSYSGAQIAIRQAKLTRGEARITVSGTLEAAPQARAGFDGDAVLHVRAEGSNVAMADVAPFLAAEGSSGLPVSGKINAQIEADGPLGAPAGSGWVELENGALFGEPVTHLRVQGTVANQVLKLTSGALEEAGGVVTASGNYDFKAKRFQVDAHAERVEISRIDWVQKHNLEATGKVGISLTGTGTLDDPQLDGHATITALTLGEQQFGTVDVAAKTANRKLNYTVTTQLEGAELDLRGETGMTGDYATSAKLDFSGFNIGAVFAMAHLEAFRGQSSLAGTVTLEGPLAHPEQLRGEARLNELAMTIAGVELKSEGGAHATLANDRVQLDPLHVTGAETDLRAEGSVDLKGTRELDLAGNGSINMKLAETLDPDLTASGVTTFHVAAKGPLEHPDLQGSIEINDGALSLEDLPNGLSQLRGTLEFNQNQLEVKSLTAMTGGGLLSVGGFLAYEHGLYADLSVTGKGVRIRYPQGVTSLADAKLQLQGSQNSLLLSGDVLITRFTANPDLDLASLAAQAAPSVEAIAPPNAPSNHIRLDVHIVSSPQLNFQNAFAKLAGDVDVRLRGTIASPSLLGRISVTQGSAMIAGTQYELQRGDITFNNPVRIEPIIDLSATARVEDYDITLGLNGTPQKLSVTYRSDPPMPEGDVLSLLAVGHTASQQRLSTQQQQQAINNPTDALLSGALNATVSSRIQKLFGAGSVKVDPNYLGAFGNSTSRITVQEQLGRDITLTYATDVNTTGQQLLQAEVAINRHVSLVVARDESGVFSIVIKATRRYR